MKAIQLLRVLKLLVFSTLFMFVSCSKPEQTESTKAPKNEKIVRLFAWSDYFDESVFERFEEKTGIKVEYVSYSDSPEMEAKLRSQPGHYDVVTVDDQAVRDFAELKLIRPLDRDRVPNLKNIDEKYRNRDFDPENAYTAPYVWGSTLVAYRADKMEEPESSWNLLWDERLKGRVMMMPHMLETTGITMLSMGHPLNSAEREHAMAAAEKLQDQIRRIDVQYGDDAAVREGLASGEIWAAMCYSGDAGMVAEENENVAYFIPEEGAPLWIDNFAIPRDSRRVDEAHQLINFMLEAEIAAANTNYTFYASPNRAAEEFIDPEILEDETVYPSAEVRKRCAFFKMPEGQEPLIREAWLLVQDSLRERDEARGTEERTERTASAERQVIGEPE